MFDEVKSGVDGLRCLRDFETETRCRFSPTFRFRSFTFRFARSFQTEFLKKGSKKASIKVFQENGKFTEPQATPGESTLKCKCFLHSLSWPILVWVGRCCPVIWRVS